MVRRGLADIIHALLNIAAATGDVVLSDRDTCHYLRPPVDLRLNLEVAIEQVDAFLHAAQPHPFLFQSFRHAIVHVKPPAVIFDADNQIRMGHN